MPPRLLLGMVSKINDHCKSAKGTDNRKDQHELTFSQNVVERAEDQRFHSYILPGSLSATGYID